MESYLQNSNKLDFQHETRDIKRYMAHYRFRFGGNRRAGLGVLSISKLRQPNMIHHQCMSP